MAVVLSREEVARQVAAQVGVPDGTTVHELTVEPYYIGKPLREIHRIAITCYDTYGTTDILIDGPLSTALGVAGALMHMVGGAVVYRSSTGLGR